MKLGQLYDICVATGISADARDRAEIDRVLAANQEALNKLDDDEKEFFDPDRKSVV